MPNEPTLFVRVLSYTLAAGVVFVIVLGLVYVASRLLVAIGG